jgi:hypothetical protein
MLLLGEIASALPDELRDRYPDVAWRQVRAFRNLAIHKYFGVDWAVVWKIAQEEPTVLEAQVLAIMRAEHPALAKDYETGPAPDPGTASLRDHGRRGSSWVATAATTQSPAARIQDAKLEPALRAAAPRSRIGSQVPRGQRGLIADLPAGRGPSCAADLLSAARPGDGGRPPVTSVP